MAVFYSCVYSLVTDTAEQRELVSTNLKLVLLYPMGFCHGENKFFLITAEASPPHYFGSRCLFIGTHQHNVLLPTTAGFVGYLRTFFSTCLYVIHSILYSFSICKKLGKALLIYYHNCFHWEKISCSINNWWKKHPFYRILTRLKKAKCIWTDTELRILLVHHTKLAKDVVLDDCTNLKKAMTIACFLNHF